MIANILPTDPPPLPPPDYGRGVKIQLLQSMVMLYIKLRESRMQQHDNKYFARRPHPLPHPWEWGQNSTFSEHGHVAYHIKGHGAPCKNILITALFLKKAKGILLLPPSVCPSVMLSPPKPLIEILPNLVCELLS